MGKAGDIFDPNTDPLLDACEGMIRNSILYDEDTEICEWKVTEEDDFGNVIDEDLTEIDPANCCVFGTTGDGDEVFLSACPDNTGYFWDTDALQCN